MQQDCLRISTIPAFNDNYLWLIDNGTHAAAIDPGDAEPVQSLLVTLELTLQTILITHHHPDHIGGVNKLVQTSHAEVIGPRSHKIPMVTQPVSEGDKFELFGHAVQVLEVPGHTLEHIAYFLPSVATSHDDQFPRLFSGDTLFAGGCGRVFEGTYEQMRTSLEKLCRLPGSTKIYCAHEYTQANLNFAQAVEPENEAIAKRIGEVALLRQNKQPSVPSQLDEELATNPFLRCSQLPVVQSAIARLGHHTPSPNDVFGSIRQWKDNF